jgi:hypothetical protein
MFLCKTGFFLSLKVEPLLAFPSGVFAYQPGSTSFSRHLLFCYQPLLFPVLSLCTFPVPGLCCSLFPASVRSFSGLCCYLFFNLFCSQPMLFPIISLCTIHVLSLCCSLFPTSVVPYSQPLLFHVPNLCCFLFPASVLPSLMTSG